MRNCRVEKTGGSEGSGKGVGREGTSDGGGCGDRSWTFGER